MLVLVKGTEENKKEEGEHSSSTEIREEEVLEGIDGAWL